MGILNGEGRTGVEKQEGKLDLNWVQATASGLAALSSAVLLSTVGVAGTVIGAAVGAIVVTVGSAVYSHYLAVTRERMAAARGAALQRASRVLNRARSAESPEGARAELARAQQELQKAEAAGRAGVRWREVLSGLRWKPVLLASAGVFVLVMGVIVSMELMTGRALSSYTGGTSADGPRTSIPLPGGLGNEDTGDERGRSGPSDRSQQDDGTREQPAREGGDTGVDTGTRDIRAGGGTEPQPAEEDTDTDTDTSDGTAGDVAEEPAPAPEEGEEVEPAPTPETEPTAEPTEEPTEEPEPAPEPTTAPSPVAPTTEPAS